jgi:hypothetical protein
VQSTALLHQGVVLVDARRTAALDSFLELILRMSIDYDIGCIGILQDGDAPVHESVVDGRCLDILPCVTIYPGMEHAFRDMAVL